MSSSWRFLLRFVSLAEMFELIWVWVKNTGYLKNPIGTRKNRPSHLISCLGVFFLTQLAIDSSKDSKVAFEEFYFLSEVDEVAGSLG